MSWSSSQSISRASKDRGELLGWCIRKRYYGIEQNPALPPWLGTLLLELRTQGVPSLLHRVVTAVTESSPKSLGDTQEHTVGKTLQRTPQNPKAAAIPGPGGAPGRAAGVYIC